ncbi:MAG: methyl-accepting chemotaxis protein, partial [Syntrophomonadaceae bacterium]|nr:methyl-accepting chemotaxis protein [Syntrophomonadaceae bacterium]
GDFRKIVEGVNETLDAVINPLGVAAHYVDRIAKGDIPEKITDAYHGDFNTIKDNLNTCIEELNRVTDAAQEVANGNLTVTIIERSEQDKLSKNVHLMIENLKKIALDLKEKSVSLATSAHQLAANAEETSAGANETASSMAEVAATVEQVAQNSEQIRIAANQTSEQAEKGKQDLEMVDMHMNDIHKTTQNAALVVKELNNMSSQIGKIVKAINHIADQTNLLALNAAIEAARAGEQGRGFAVVADEVRKLAEQSSRATSEIQELIQNAQCESGKAVEAMNDSLEQVQSGVKIVNNAGETFGKIIQQVKDLAFKVEEIAVSNGEVAHTVQYVSSATQESTAAMEEVASATEVLNHLAVDLQQMADQFIVE